MKIFAIGLSKTATKSLTRALRILGYKAVHYGYTRKIIRYQSGKLRIDFGKLDDYDAFTDIPIARIYKQLDARYPGSKFILTIRDMNSWLGSCKRKFKDWPHPELKNKESTRYQLRLDVFGTVFFDKEKFKAAYNRHINDILNYFKRREKDLLILNICDGEGWEKLCSFLNKPIPKEPFPKLNVSKSKLNSFSDGWRYLRFMLMYSPKSRKNELLKNIK